MSMYLLLYRGINGPGDLVGKMEEEAERSRWQMEICNSLIDGGSQTCGGTKITLDDTEPLPEKPVTNYCIIEASNRKEAVELSRGAPDLYSGGSAEVYELDEEV
jgi:hypothetical protein